MKVVGFDVPPKKKTQVLKLYHMSQHCAHPVSSHHRRNKKQPLICHHCGKYGHTRPYCFEWLKLNIKGGKEIHYKKKCNTNTTSTGFIEQEGSSSTSWYSNSEGTRYMARDKTSHGNNVM